MLVCWFSFRSHKTWGEKVSGKNWPGQPGQHRHVQETSLPGGNEPSDVSRVHGARNVKDFSSESDFCSCVCHRCLCVRCSRR